MRSRFGDRPPAGASRRRCVCSSELFSSSTAASSPTSSAQVSKASTKSRTRSRNSSPRAPRGIPVRVGVTRLLRVADGRRDRAHRQVAFIRPRPDRHSRLLDAREHGTSGRARPAVALPRSLGRPPRSFSEKSTGGEHRLTAGVRLGVVWETPHDARLDVDASLLGVLQRVRDPHRSWIPTSVRVRLRVRPVRVQRLRAISKRGITLRTRRWA